MYARIPNYLDLVEWVRSPMNSKKEYSITLFQSLIFHRLLKYSRQNEKITYSNRIISEHMFRGQSQIENNLPVLTKKGLIKTKVTRKKDEHNNVISKRTITINWEKLIEIKNEMDSYLNVNVEHKKILSEIEEHEKCIMSLRNKLDDNSDKVINNEVVIQKTYLIKNNRNGLYKIGKSYDPKYRERTLQSEEPDISMVKMWDYDIEEFLHRKYDECRVRGEWFKLNKTQVNFICKHF
jgi:hypothetical protein